LLADFRLRSARERHLGDEAQYPAFEAECVAAFAAGLADGSLRSWLAFDGRTAIGTVTLFVLPTLPRVGARGAAGKRRDARVRNVFVDPAYRRHGIASSLMRELLAEVRRIEIDRMALGSTQMGRPLYERLGFFPKTEEMYFPLDS
jgi:GNAT superfamily N-acetyltransferase